MKAGKFDAALSLMTDLSDRVQNLVMAIQANEKVGHSKFWATYGLKQPIKNEIKIVRRLLSEFEKSL